MQVDAAQVVVDVGGDTAAGEDPLSAGDVSELKVYLRDEKGNIIENPQREDWEVSFTLNPMTSGGSPLTGTYSSEQGQSLGDTIIFDRIDPDGAIIFSYAPQEAGQYSVDLTINNQVVPVEQTVSVQGTGTVDPEVSVLDAPETVQVSPKAGAISSFGFTLKDAFGNPILTQDPDVLVDLSVLSADPVTGQSFTLPMQPIAAGISLEEAVGEIDSGDSGGGYSLLFNEQTGEYTVEYLVISAGLLSAGVEIAGASIAGSPFEQVITAGTTSSQDSTVKALPKAVVGVATEFTVTARDEFGNPTGSTTEDFIAVYNGQTVDMISNGDGTYTGRYIPSQPADGGESILDIYLGGNLVTGGCPGNIAPSGGCIIELLSASSGRFDPGNTVISSSRPGVATDGQKYDEDGNLVPNIDEAGNVIPSGSVTVQTFDSDGLPYIYSADSAGDPPQFQLELVLLDVSGEPTGEVISFDPVAATSTDGTVTLPYTTEIAGNYDLRVVQIFDNQAQDVEPTAENPIPTVVVLSAETSSAHSTVDIITAPDASGGQIPIQTGVPFEVSITPRDRFGNIVEYGPTNLAADDSFEVSISGTGTLEPIPAALDTDPESPTYGNWIAELSVTNPGEFSISTALNGNTLTSEDGQDLDLPTVVENSPISPAMTVLEGEDGITAGMAGSHSFSMDLRDALGNPISYVDSINSTWSCSVSVQGIDGEAKSRVAKAAQCEPAASCSEPGSEVACRYNVDYAATRSGTYKITVDLCPLPTPQGFDCSVGDSPLTVEMAARPTPDAGKSVLVAAVRSTVTYAGDSVAYRVQTKDTYGNPNTAAGAFVEIYARRSDSDSLSPSVFGETVYDNSTTPPFHVMSITFPEGGANISYEVFVLVNGQNVLSRGAASGISSPFLLPVSGAAVSAVRTVVYSPEEAPVAGTPGTMLLQVWIDQFALPVFQVSIFSNRCLWTITQSLLNVIQDTVSACGCLSKLQQIKGTEGVLRLIRKSFNLSTHTINIGVFPTEMSSAA